MKLTDIKTESAKEIIEETVLQENLGNLAKLNIGPLINVLKQPSNGRSGSAGPVDKKFQTYNIGSTSEIVDVGQLKDGLKSLRKAYKDQLHLFRFVYCYIVLIFCFQRPHHLIPV